MKLNTVEASQFVLSEYGAIVGKTIMAIRPMNATEIELFGWDEGWGGVPMVIILSDGTAIVPSADPEGNGPGHLFLEKTE